MTTPRILSNIISMEERLRKIDGISIPFRVSLLLVSFCDEAVCRVHCIDDLYLGCLYHGVSSPNP